MSSFAPEVSSQHELDGNLKICVVDPAATDKLTSDPYDNRPAHDRYYKELYCVRDMGNATTMRAPPSR